MGWRPWNFSLKLPTISIPRGTAIPVCPKVIFLDLKLPKMSGLEVLNQIKRDERTHLIPVVVLTSSQEESDILESYALGVNSYMVKPVDYDAFSRAVGDLGLYWLRRNKTVH